MSLDISYLCSRKKMEKWKGKAVVRAGNYEEMTLGPTDPIFNSADEAMNFLQDKLRATIPIVFFRIINGFPLSRE